MYRTLVDPVVHVPARKVVHLVQRGTVKNNDVWHALYKQRAATSRSQRNRVDSDLATSLWQTRLTDKDVLKLLQALANRAPVTPYRDELLLRVRRAIASCHYRLIREVRLICVGQKELEDLMAHKPQAMSLEGLCEKDFWDYQLSKLLAKYPFAGYDEVSKRNALDEFALCEALNARQNDRVADEWNTNHELANELRNRLAAIMGPAPTLDELTANGTWGPGTNAAYSFTSSATGPEFKFSARVSMTPSVLPLATTILPQYGLWCGHLQTAFDQEWSCLVPGNSLQTVPKKFGMDRTMSAEPLFNSWVQAALGTILRRRFRATCDWDLDNAWQDNQRMAYQGSLSGEFATEDMKNASSRIAREVVRALVPMDWLPFLEQARSRYILLTPGPSGLLNELGRRHKLEMFSSMGNGFTFELESALFMAVAQVVTPPRLIPTRKGLRKSWKGLVSVFGDDVVLPSERATAFREVCREIGMETNLEKSYMEGPFRESCGVDFHRGVDIRPLFISERIDDGFQLIELVNRIRTFAHRKARTDNLGFGSERWAGMWALAHSYIPGPIRSVMSTPPHVPGGIWDRFDVAAADSLTGCSPVWRVIIKKTVACPLSSELFLYDTSKGDRNWWYGNGDNLLAARLTPVRPPGWVKDARPTTEFQSRVEQLTGITGRLGGDGFKGDRSPLRYNNSSKVVYSSMVEGSSWLGWKRLISDFSAS